MSHRPDTAVIHLVRAVYGVGPFRAFVRSYNEHRAGADHELVLLCKGFAGGVLYPEWREVLGATPATALFFPDVGMDISSYFEIAARLGHRYLCFVNTWSRILADDWLATLHRYGTAPDVGLVGATAAWYSLYTVNLLSRQQQSRSDEEARQHESALEPMRRYFPPFPNPYIRTNGFFIERTFFASLWGGNGTTKLQALFFELGAGGMTRQTVARGRKALVVGRDGRAYEPESWPASRTFRAGNQENLLISDNRTEMYARAGGSTRAALAWTTWGGAAGDDVPSRMQDVGPVALADVPPGLFIFPG